MFLFMSVNCCMCLTIECRKSHSRKLVYEQIMPVENTQTFDTWCTLLGRPCVNVLCTIYLEGFYTEVFSIAGFYRGIFLVEAF